MIKIATFNANSIRSRMGIVTRWLDANKPDVLCIQETKVRNEDFPQLEFEAAGYHPVFSGEKSYNGVATLSRLELSDVHLGFDDEPSDSSRLIAVRAGPLIVVNTYVPQGYLPTSEKFTYKLEWFGRLKDFISRHFKHTDLIAWVGDLNIAPEPIDVYDPVRLSGSVCFHPAVQEELRKVMAWGFVDAFRIHNKEPKQYTYWDYRYPKNLEKDTGWRLDHIMVTKPLAKLCRSCYIDKKPRLEANPSDHTFVIAEFDIPD
jgi:exodeoxyribonuclease-3